VASVAGVATLWMAIMADTGASVIVIANALRLLRAD
jgi:Cd2+/Zn2+-exporting ATPase